MTPSSVSASAAAAERPAKFRRCGTEVVDDVGADDAEANECLSRQQAGFSRVKSLCSWPREIVGLCDRLAAQGVPSCLAEHVQSPDRKIWVTSSYSGMGTFEHVLRRIGAELDGQAKSADVLGPFHFWSAHEIDAEVRSFLLQSKHCPTHVFGDLEQQFDEQAVGQLKFTVRCLRERALAAAAGEAPSKKKEIMDAASERCMKKVIALAKRAVAKGKSFCSGYCFVHQKECPYFPTKGPEDIRLEVAGNTCVAFSPQGKRERWLHDSAVPAAIWMATSSDKRSDFRHLKVDWVLQECSHAFNTEDAMEEAFSPRDGWLSSVLQLSPFDVAVPISRNRKFSWTVDEEKFTVLQPISRDLLLGLCGGPPKCNGHDFFAAPQEAVESFQRRMVEQRRIRALFSPMGESVLPTGSKARLLAYRHKHKSDAGAGRNANDCAIWDLSQNVEVRGKMSSVLPSPLCRSMLWSEQHLREMTPSELFFAMGWPVPSIMGGDEDGSFPFDEQVFSNPDVKPSLLAKMTGNSVHCRVAGFLLAYALAVTTRHPEEP